MALWTTLALVHREALSNGLKNRFLTESPPSARVVFVFEARAPKIWLLAAPTFYSHTLLNKHKRNCFAK